MLTDSDREKLLTVVENMRTGIMEGDAVRMYLIAVAVAAFAKKGMTPEQLSVIQEAIKGARIVKITDEHLEKARKITEGYRGFSKPALQILDEYVARWILSKVEKPNDPKRLNLITVGLYDVAMIFDIKCEIRDAEWLRASAPILGRKIFEATEYYAAAGE